MSSVAAGRECLLGLRRVPGGGWDLPYGLTCPIISGTLRVERKELRIREEESQPRAHSKAGPLRDLAPGVRPSFPTPTSSSGLCLRHRH